MGGKHKNKSKPGEKLKKLANGQDQPKTGSRKLQPWEEEARI